MYIPMRTCSVCRKKHPKTELLRIVKMGNEFFVDQDGKMDGRGAYICKDSACIQKCIAKKLLNRSFKMQIEDELYETLAKLHF